jgi:hypothetical protein
MELVKDWTISLDFLDIKKELHGTFTPIQSHTSSWEVPAPIEPLESQFACHFSSSIQNRYISLQKETVLYIFKKDVLVATITSPDQSLRPDFMTWSTILSFYMSNSIKTCVLIGYQSGFFRVYDCDGTLVSAQQFHNQPITHISARTITNPITTADSDQILLLYKDFRVVTIDAAGVWMSLRMLATDDMFEFEPIPLSFKKYKLNELENLQYCFSLGPSDNTLFPPRFEGFQLDYAPFRVKERFLSFGDPFVALSSLPEQSEALLGDVATKLSNAVSSALKWLQSESKEGQQQTLRIKPDCVLTDPYRYPKFVSFAPSRLDGIKRYAAISDSLGRVSLFHIQEFVILKLWKGWRDAQVGWIQTKDMLSDDMILFLVLYSNQTGVLEIITVPNGDNISSDRVGKGLKLISSSSELVGSMHAKEKKHLLSDCHLLYPNGDLKRIVLKEESLVLARPSQFVALQDFVNDYISNKQEMILDQIYNEICGYNYVVVQLRSLQYLTSIVPIEFYEKVLCSLIDPLLVKRYLKGESADFSTQQLILITQLHFLTEYQILQLSTKFEENHLDAEKSDLDYLTFISSFSALHQGPFTLNDELTDSTRYQTIWFLLSLIFKGYSYDMVFGGLFIRPVEIIILLRTFLQNITTVKLSDLKVQKITTTLFNAVSQSGDTEALDLLHQYTISSKDVFATLLCGNVLLQLSLSTKNLALESNMKALVAKGNMLLPFYRLLDGDCRVPVMEFDTSETTSIPHLLAVHFDSTFQNLVTEDTHHSEAVFISRCSELLQLTIETDIVRTYQLFLTLRKWDIYQEICSPFF